MKVKIASSDLGVLSAGMSFSEGNLCPAVDVSFPIGSFDKVRNKVGDDNLLKEISALIYNGVPICSGYIENYSYQKESVTAKMRNKASVIVDSSLIVSKKQKKIATVYEIINDIVSSFGLSVIDNNSGALTKKVKDFIFKTGDNAFDVLAKIATDNGIFVSSSSLGNVILSPQERKEEPFMLQGVEDITYRRDNSKIFGEYRGYLKRESIVLGIKEDVHIEKEPMGNPKKVWVKVVEEQEEKTDIKALVLHEKKVRRLNAETFSASCSGLMQGGKFVELGQSVLLEYQNKVYNLHVKGFNLRWGSEGEKAVYDLVNKGVFQLEDEGIKKLDKDLLND